MPLELLTLRDLQSFKLELFAEIQKLIVKDAKTLQPYLKSKELCRLLKISPGTLQKMRKENLVKFTKLGGTIYYKRDEVERMLSGERVWNTKRSG